MSELRWALLIVGGVFFAALTAWELRRPRQARGAEPLPPTPPAPREDELELPEMHAREPLAVRHPPLVELPEDLELTDDPAAIPVLSPASEEAHVAVAPAAAVEEGGPQLASAEVSAERQFAEYDDAPRDLPQQEDGEPQPAYPEASAEGESGVVGFALPQAAGGEVPELPGAAAPSVDWPPDAERRVVALRLVATQSERFAGRSLRQALAAEGFVLGRFDIFHKGDEERRTVLSAASLTRPGTFDVETMDSQHFGGLSLFAVLPGPMSPPQAFEELVTTARSLNNRLCGVLQDEAGMPLTPARIALLRERIASGAPS